MEQKEMRLHGRIVSSISFNSDYNYFDGWIRIIIRDSFGGNVGNNLGINKKVVCNLIHWP